MADWYYATVTYSSGDKVTLAHKGQVPTSATRRLMRQIGASIEIGDPVPPEKAGQYEDASLCVARGRRMGWHPQMEVPEVDDA